VVPFFPDTVEIRHVLPLLSVTQTTTSAMRPACVLTATASTSTADSSASATSASRWPKAAKSASVSPASSDEFRLVTPSYDRSEGRENRYGRNQLADSYRCRRSSTLSYCVTFPSADINTVDI